MASHDAHSADASELDVVDDHDAAMATLDAPTFEQIVEAGFAVSHDVRSRRGVYEATPFAYERPRPVQYLIKRLLDVSVAALLLVVLSPVLAALAMAIKITTPGPALYRSRRMGLGGQVFTCLKFRTMYVGAEKDQAKLEALNEAHAPIFKIEEDPRVTRIGHWLRATSLDELPQLINVLRCQMSLVGPRPLPLRDCELLTSAQKRRHTVMPGMTGLWQITDNRHDEDIVTLDLEYVDGWSLWSDFVILLRTAGVVVRSLINPPEAGIQP